MCLSVGDPRSGFQEDAGLLTDCIDDYLIEVELKDRGVRCRCSIIVKD